VILLAFHPKNVFFGGDAFAAGPARRVARMEANGAYAEASVEKPPKALQGSPRIPMGRQGRRPPPSFHRGPSTEFEEA